MTFDGPGLFAGLAVSSVGGGFFLYGKRVSDFAALLVGIVLGIYPFFVESASAQYGVGAVILLGFYLGRRRGMF